GSAGPGNVNVTQTNSLGCDSTVALSVTIRPTPVPVITGNTTPCSNKVNAYSITASAGNTYLWTVTGGTITGTNTTSSINVLWGSAGSGNISVIQTNSFGCDSTVASSITIRPTPV